MKECFNCGSYYNPEQSTASEEYKATYDTKECEQASEAALEAHQMEKSAELEQASATLSSGLLFAGNFAIKKKEG